MLVEWCYRFLERSLRGLYPGRFPVLEGRRQVLELLHLVILVAECLFQRGAFATGLGEGLQLRGAQLSLRSAVESIASSWL